jgi:hypothetical protein
VAARGLATHAPPALGRNPYDSVRLDLLPQLEPAWRAQLAHAVGHVGLIGALRRVSGSNREPATGGLP